MRQRRRHFVRFIHYLVSKESAAAAANNDNDVEQKKQREWLNSSRRNTD